MPHAETLAPRDIELTAELLSALDSELRLSILLLLDAKDHVVHEMVTELGKSQPLVSQHLKVLKDAGLVVGTRVGREVVYSLARPEIIGVIMKIAAFAANDELDQRRIAAASGAAIVSPPTPIRPDEDPGLVPRTPRPRRD